MSTSSGEKLSARLSHSADWRAYYSGPQLFHILFSEFSTSVRVLYHVRPQSSTLLKRKFHSTSPSFSSTLLQRHPSSVSVSNMAEKSGNSPPFQDGPTGSPNDDISTAGGGEKQYVGQSLRVKPERPTMQKHGSWFDSHRPSQVLRPDGKRELKEKECWDKLAYSWPTWKKSMYLASIAGIQISMNFNTSVFPSAVKPISEHFGVSVQAARVGQMIYLVFYAFGCELWAPWSEEFGRWPILQLSMLFINIWNIPNSVAPNFATILVCRALVSHGIGNVQRKARLTYLGWSFYSRWKRDTWSNCRPVRARDSALASLFYRPILHHWNQHWWRHWWTN